MGRWDGLGVDERKVVDGAVGQFVTYLALHLSSIILDHGLSPTSRASGR